MVCGAKKGFILSLGVSGPLCKREMAIGVDFGDLVGLEWPGMGLFFVGGVLSTVLVEDGDLGIFFRFGRPRIGLSLFGGIWSTV